MYLNFFIKYSTNHGENIDIVYKQNPSEHLATFHLSYYDKNLWHGSLFLDDKVLNNNFEYEVLLKKAEWQHSYDLLAVGTIDVLTFNKKEFNIVHENFPLKQFIGLTKTKPFNQVFKPANHKSIVTSAPKNATHIFEIESPFLQENKYVCLTGSAIKMNNFNDKKPLLFKKSSSTTSTIELDLSKEKFPIEFKIGIFDIDTNHIIAYEPGDNHLISEPVNNNCITKVYLNHSFDNYAWKGAGINVPVFSLRTDNGWGVGDFTNIKLLVDYAKSIGFKLIQLLPINDTTGAYTDKDSYPYSAITSFGLHPKFLNVKKLAEASKTILTKKELIEIERLNKLTYSDHSAVVDLKINVLKRVFEVEKNTFIKTTAWSSFFAAHKNWLVPFSAFCVLRDKYSTPDFEKWGEYAVYNEEQIQLFTNEENECYNDVLFWYFVQFNLHLQLEEAIAYAHTNGIVLKADLPIGVGRNSADTWQYTNLFVMGMQAGAPPDAFSGSGQNWSFPTYNFDEMAKDGYAWFRKRMQHLQTYFDAVRIDHVLGIFRIWSIPLNQVEGTMGRFVPAIPMHIDEFHRAGLYFSEDRFCEPFITDEILYEKFGNDIGIVKDIFFRDGKLANEYNDQRKVATYFATRPENIRWQQGLFDLICNVLLFKDAYGYHFRINMFQISSYKNLSAHEKGILDKLYHRYFFEMQNELWKKEGEIKLEMMTDSTSMLLCAEDLGMVPDFTDEVLKALDILSLQVQQMPKDSSSAYSNTAQAKYESIVMPATHDMSPMRLWWEENRVTTQNFYNEILQENGEAPNYCEPWVCRKILEKHMQSPAMLCIFLMQDILALNPILRLENPNDERINVPSNPDHVWNYRMHITLEKLIQQSEFNEALKAMAKQNGR
jgi:4-alpha-glucanotransferase